MNNIMLKLCSSQLSCQVIYRFHVCGQYNSRNIWYLWLLFNLRVAFVFHYALHVSIIEGLLPFGVQVL